MKEERTSGSMTDMTQGSPTRLILLFSLPLVAGNMLQQMYNMVDSMVVGNYVGKTALAAVGTGFPIIFMVAALFIGLGMGATIIIAQYYGAGDEKSIIRTVETIYTSLMVGAIPVTLIGMGVCGPLLRLIQVPADTFPQAHLYMLIVFGGILGSLGFNINSGILQGLGDSRSPLLFLAIACAINIVLDLLFVIRFGWGVAGVAIATIIAQFCSWIFGIFYINRRYPQLRIRPFHFAFHGELFAKVIKLGIPAGVQQALFSLGMMALQVVVNRHGSDFMAGFNGANKLDTFAFMPVQSFGNAVTTFVGQNMGAGRLDRVRSGTRGTLAMAGIFSVGAAILLIGAGPLLMRLFSQEEAVIQAGMAYLVDVMPFYWVLAGLIVLCGVVRGAGEMLVPMLANLLSLWLVRVPAGYLLDSLLGPDKIFYCYAIGWALGLCIISVYYLSGRWKSKAVVTPLAQP